MFNNLEVGASRTGFVTLAGGAGDNLAASLHRTAEGVEMVTPLWGLGDHRDLATALRGDDPAAWPDSGTFVDVEGHVALVGCHPRSYQESGGSGVDRAKWEVGFAVLGARDPGAYATIHGFRSEIDGLGAWMRIDTIDHAMDEDDEGPFLTYRLRYREPVTVAPSMGTRVLPSPTPRSGAHADETILTERTFVETSTDIPLPWWDHIDQHLAIRDLVRVAAWKPLRFLSHEARRDDDPLVAAGGEVLDRTAWRKVISSRTDLAAAPESAHHFGMLFSYADVSPGGVECWIDFWKHNRRAAETLALLDLRGASLPAHVAQLGRGLEALAYTLARADRVSRDAADQEPFVSKVRRVAAAIPYALHFDADEAAVDLAAAYRRVKHPKSALPDRRALESAYWRGLALFRLWVAALIGVQAKAVEGEFARWPLHLDNI